MVHIVDNAGWHARDAQFGANRLTKQAFVRGGLLLSWLVNYDFLTYWVQDNAAEALQRYSEETRTPGELYQEMDGMLATDMVKPEARKFVVCRTHLRAAKSVARV